jgi:hypothetical protein
MGFGFSGRSVCVRLISSIGAAVVVAALFIQVSAAQGPAAIQTISDAALQARTTTVGGAPVLATTRTVAHWWGSSLDPDNGVTYGYNMVGADPNSCSGSGCAVTIDVDITPLNVVVGGRTFNGSDVLAATLASPQFALNDYGTTPAATAAGQFPNAPAFIRGPGGALSQGDANQMLQLQDATMRAQFNKTGTSSYHVRLHPVVHPALTIVVPGNRGTLLQSGRGVVFADVNLEWWATQLQNLDSKLSYIDPTHLPLYLTNDMLLFLGNNPLNTGYIGFHGAGTVPGSTGSVHGNGNQPVQTYAWASYLSPASTRGRTAARIGRCKTFTRSATKSPSGPTIRS